MKRSDVNRLIEAAEAFFARHGFNLPPFAHWGPDRWRTVSRQDHIVKANLGWDLTDFGRGAYDRCGLMLFTVRNGLAGNLGRGEGVVYAEKIMIQKRDQKTPMHRHRVKTEDIINRAGGTLAIELFTAAGDGSPDPEKPVRYLSDGLAKEVSAGTILRFRPGESITLFPGVHHAFWAEGEDVMIGEVSSVNDDATDNFFAEPVARFPTIEDDELPARLIVGDYPKFCKN